MRTTRLSNAMGLLLDPSDTSKLDSLKLDRLKPDFFLPQVPCHKIGVIPTTISQRSWYSFIYIVHERINACTAISSCSKIINF